MEYLTVTAALYLLICSISLARPIMSKTLKEQGFGKESPDRRWWMLPLAICLAIIMAPWCLFFGWLFKRRLENRQKPKAPQTVGV